MHTDTCYTAVDIGTSTIRVLVARLHPNGVLEAIGSGLVPSRGVQKGVIVHIADAEMAVRAALEEASRSAGVDIGWVTATVGGSHLEASTRWGTVHSTHYALPISQETLQRAVDAAYPRELSPDRELLHLVPKNYSLDGLEGIRNPLGMHATRVSVETLCITGASTPLRALVQALEHSRCKVRYLVAGGLACGESALTRDEREVGVLLVDIGGGSTTVAYYQHGALWNLAVLPVGGWHFTNDLAVAFKMPWDVAEDTKLRWGSVVPDVSGPEEVEVAKFGERGTSRVARREVVRHLRERGIEVLRLVYYTIRQTFALRAVPPAGIVLAGGTANLRGLDALFREGLDAPVRVATPRGVEGLPHGWHAPSCAAVVGALVWGTRQAVSHRGSLGAQNGHKEKPMVSVMHWLRERARRVAL
ncbi:MAG: cell division protein FtsA [Dehalococcoidia bacterium]|nr:cell division protein FtsA [Dehalococcoidia bacterium]MDW8119776.1 cell division protein FtsA [Chloroflexota bacterium]